MKVYSHRPVALGGAIHSFVTSFICLCQKEIGGNKLSKKVKQFDSQHMPNYRLTKAFYQFSLQTAVGNSTEVTKRSAERFSSLTQTV